MDKEPDDESSDEKELIVEVKPKRKRRQSDISDKSFSTWRWAGVKKKFKIDEIAKGK